MKNENVSMGWKPWLSLYKVRGHGLLQREGSPDRGVKSLREVLDNLACKLCRLLVFVGAWLLSWSCGHVATGESPMFGVGN
jgi:hypothetical protein